MKGHREEKVDNPRNVKHKGNTTIIFTQPSLRQKAAFKKMFQYKYNDS